jgi:tyrosyl-tRNA synthetase
MDAKQQLAAELVARFHGSEAANKAAADFVQRFQRRELPSEIETFSWTGKEAAVWICHLLREAGLAKSTSEARRLILQGGVRLDGEKLEDSDLQVLTQGEKVIQVGRRRVMRVIFGQPTTA